VRHSLVVTLLVVFACVGVYAQEGDTDFSQPWQIVFYPTTGSATVSDITGYVEAGYLPVGFEIRPDSGLAVLLVRGTLDELKGWQIHEYTDWNALEREITESIRAGFVPMDISRYGDVLSILWVEAEMEIAGWRITTCPNTLSERARAVNNLQAQGFTLWGLSIHDDLVWLLFLSRPDREQRTGSISVFSPVATEFQSAIAEVYDQGWRPNGLGTDGDSLYICFSR
jgi:hypothetical protein